MLQHLRREKPLTGYNRLFVCLCALLLALSLSGIIHAEDNTGQNLLAGDDLLADDDLLASDDFEFQELSQEAPESHWYDGLKTSLSVNYTLTPDDIYLQRGEARLEYDFAPQEGWFFRADGLYRYFFTEDALVEGRDDRQSYGVYKWQDLWLQYSAGACAHKAGRQKLIWGEVEGTFAVDVISPFDYTEQLLTDYANLRLAQDMLFSECYFDGLQTQVFFVPEAKTDVLQHHPSQFSGVNVNLDTGSEYGGRLKLLWEGGDISLMLARLYQNQPAVILENFQLRTAVSRYEFVGLSSSIAVSRLLLKMDIGYKTDQLLQVSGDRSDRLDAAIGFEYTTTDNHSLNGGVWTTRYLDGDSKPDPTNILTLGWSKTYFNDDLAMSLLGNWVDEPRLFSTTLLAEYQLNDFWNVSCALGYADNEEEQPFLPLAQQDKSVTLAVKVEF